MKYIVFICRLSEKDKLLGLLKDSGIIRVICSEVVGYDQEQSRDISHRGEIITVNHSPRLKLETVINDESLPAVYKAAEQIGSGKLFVLPLEEAYSPKNSARGNDAV